ncbi:MAG: MarR family winged helix-turn-helix transcriptional regulator [Beijerinckiaceae bacterium]
MMADKPMPELEIYTMPGHLIRRLHQASIAIFDNEVRLAGFDLTPVQFAALMMIASRPGLDQATLAQGIAYDRVTIGGVIDRLENKGLVRRVVDATDRRARKLFLEPAGKKMLAKVRPVVDVVQQHIFASLSDSERKTVLRLMRKALNDIGDVSRASAKVRQSA